jgi:hypothetical protein
MISRIQALKILNPIPFILILFQNHSGLNPLIIPDTIRQWVGIAIAIATLLPLAYNWAWIRANIFRRR